MPDTPKTLPPIWGDDENLRMRSDDAPETELSKALRLIMSPGFAGREAPPRDPQPPLPSTDETQGVDTSSEAVERLATNLGENIDIGIPFLRALAIEHTAATLRALAAERTILRKKVAVLIADGLVMQSERDAAIARAEAAERERDALLAVARAATACGDSGIHALDADGLSAIEKLYAALDALPPEVRAKLDQSE